MDKSKENTLIYIGMYIYTYSHGHTNIFKYRYTFSHIHMMYYSSQAWFLALYLKLFKLFTFLIESGKLLEIEGLM